MGVAWEDLEILFKSFGHYMVELKLSSEIFEWDFESGDALKLIRDFCLCEKMEEITLDSFDRRSNDLIDNLINKFKNMKKFQLSSCEFHNNIHEICNILPNMNELTLTHCKYVHKDIPTNFLLTTNTNLIRFKIRNVKKLDIISILKNINLIMPNLQDLEINNIFDYYDMNEIGKFLPNIGSLNKLIKLKINFNRGSSKSLLKRIIDNKIKLEKLTIISTSYCHDMIELITEIKSLKELKFSEIRNLNPMSLVRTISELPLLKKLSIHRTCMVLNQPFVNDLSESIRNGMVIELSNYEKNDSYFQKLNLMALTKKLKESHSKLTIECFGNPIMSPLIRPGKNPTFTSPKGNLTIKYVHLFQTYSLVLNSYDVSK